MLKPSYAELMDVMNKDSNGDVTSRYTVVIAAAKRARQLIDADAPMIDKPIENKPLSTAVEEISQGKVKIVPEGEGTVLMPKKTNEEEEIVKELKEMAYDSRKMSQNDKEQSEDIMDLITDEDKRIDTNKKLSALERLDPIAGFDSIDGFDEVEGDDVTDDFETIEDFGIIEDIETMDDLDLSDDEDEFGLNDDEDYFGIDSDDN